MHNSKYLSSLAIVLGLGLAGCSLDTTKSADTSNERTSGGTSEPSDKPVAKDKGRLGLKMPSQGNRPYKTLTIYLEKSDCGSIEPPQPLPEPMPYEVPADDMEKKAKQGVSKDDTDDVGADDRDVGSDDSIDYVEEPISPACSEYVSVERTVDFEEGAVVSIDDLIPGGYSLYVSLQDGEGNTIEEGYGWADVAPGIVSNAVVELYPTQGNGSLDIEILRAGDRSHRYNRHDRYEDEGYGTCGNDGGDYDVAVSSDEAKK